ncbi:MAG: FIST C-terminal domain-containing protein, partial [Nanoarchaeota archaeon]|nr:FIST C-terminal domain-containing protein [Nanoarchaeota archaeon]
MKMKRKYKVAAVVAAAAIILVLTAVWLMQSEKAPGFVIEPAKPLEEKEPGMVSVGYGWSAMDDETEAVGEAVAKLKQGLKDKAPEYAILYLTAGYDADKAVEEVNRILPETKLYGSTSMKAVLTSDGYHIGKKGSLALLAIASERITAGVGGAEIGSSAKEAGKEAAMAAVGSAKKNGKPNIILMTAAPGKEEEILEGIAEVVGSDVPVIGGSSGDNDLTGKWKQFANGKVYSNGVALTVFYTDLSVGYMYEGGYEKIEKYGTITKAEGRVIYEIDNRPAAGVYNEWTGGAISEELEKGGSVLTKTNFFPLAKVIEEGQDIYYLSIHPLSVNPADKSLSVFANVETGDEVTLMQGNWEMLLNRVKSTSGKAMLKAKAKPGESYFGVYHYCAGTMLAIPETEIGKMPALINQQLGDAP